MTCYLKFIWLNEKHQQGYEKHNSIKPLEMEEAMTYGRKQSLWLRKINSDEPLEGILGSKQICCELCD